MGVLQTVLEHERTGIRVETHKDIAHCLCSLMGGVRPWGSGWGRVCGGSEYV